MAMITAIKEIILLPWIALFLPWFFVIDLIANETVRMIVLHTIGCSHLLSYFLSITFLILKIVNIKIKSEKIKKINRVLFWFFVFFLVIIIVGIVCACFERPLAKIFNPELYESLEQERLYYLENRK